MNCAADVFGIGIDMPSVLEPPVLSRHDRRALDFHARLSHDAYGI
jgi:hypothetical protein